MGYADYRSQHEPCLYGWKGVKKERLEDRTQTTLWEGGRDTNYVHPTQKPLSLISQLIEKHSNSGDLVLDNFAGTGTVGEACVKLGRDYILIEKEETYFNMIGDRLNKSIIS